MKGTLCGLIAALAYKLLEKVNRVIAVFAAAVLCPVVNTGVFLLGCQIFFLPTVSEWAAMAGYENAGTIEFLLDEKTSQFYFMEMNTRVQVEHPVTEFVTGVDIVKEQIRIAAGQELSVTQDDIKITGHAIECRINAENPKFNFAPSPGKITDLYLPSGGVGLRVDSAVYHGYTIPPYYDSMIAKIIVHGENRFDALMKMQRALYELEIEGVTTNVEFQMDLICDEHVIAGDYDTSFLMETFLPNYNKEND